VLRPRPHWGSAPLAPELDLRGPTCKGRKDGKEWQWREEGNGKKGGEGRKWEREREGLRHGCWGMDAPVRVHVISPVDDGRICGTGKCVAWCETVTE